ncbi:MAG: SH3 domain-containing protein [Candidatus Aminicenantales bacterium]
MKRIAILCLVIFTLAFVGLWAQETTILKVKVQVANIRSEPDINASIIKQMKIGTTLESHQKIGDWYEVMVTDDKGLSMSGFINISVVDVASHGGIKPEQGALQAEVKPVKTPIIDSSKKVGVENDFLFGLGGGLP